MTALAIPDVGSTWTNGAIELDRLCINTIRTRAMDAVISSWLLDLSAAAPARDFGIEEFCGFVHDFGQSRWTVDAAIKEAGSADVITAAMFALFACGRITPSAKMLSAARFGLRGQVEGQEPIDPEPKLEDGHAVRQRKRLRAPLDSAAMLDKAPIRIRRAHSS